MAVPKWHRAKGNQGKRRMHIFLRGVALTSCLKCGKPTRSHIACPSCGFYKGREIVNTLKKATKRAKKASEMKKSK